MVPFNSCIPVKCITDHLNNTTDAIVKCTKSGAWELPSSCKNIYCSNLQVPNGMSVKYNSPNTQTHNPGSTAVFLCSDDQFLIGNDSVICTSEGIWSGPIPKCANHIKMELQIGKNASMVCKKSAGSPGCTVISWLFNGKLINHANNHHLPHVIIYKNILSINKFNESAEGLYECYCFNLILQHMTTLAFNVILKTDKVQLTTWKQGNNNENNKVQTAQYKTHGRLRNKRH